MPVVTIAVTWDGGSGRALTLGCDALTLEHTPGSRPCLAHLLPYAPHTWTKPQVVHVEARAITHVQILGTSRGTTATAPIALPALTSAEDRVKAHLDLLNDAERLIAYRYLFHQGVRIHATTEAHVKRALARLEPAREP